MPTTAKVLLAAYFWLLPYVLIEPAPVDAVVFVLCVLTPFLRPELSRRSILLFGGIAMYMTFSALSLFPYFSSLTSVGEYSLKYILTELYLCLSIISIYCLVSKDPLMIAFSARHYVIGALLSCIFILVGKYVLHHPLIFRDDSAVRVRGFFKDPNVLGPYLIFPILHIAVSAKPILQRLALATPMAVVLFLTYSRGAYIGLMIGIAWVGFASLQRNINAIHLSRLLFFLAVCFVTGSVVFFIFSEGIISKASTASDYLVERAQLQDYDSIRFHHFKLALEEAAVHPLGLGPGMFAEKHGNNPHNLFLGKLTDAGWVPGILITMFLLCGTLKSLYYGRQSAGAISLELGGTLAAHLALAAIIYCHHWRHLFALLAIAFAMRPVELRISSRVRDKGIS